MSMRKLDITGQLLPIAMQNTANVFNKLSQQK